MSDVYIPYLTPPSAIINQALDRLGADEGKIIGDVGTDGTRVAETARRNYGQALRQLLRAAHWSFARKNAPLTLLGDASGTSLAPVSPYVENPWCFAYAWPTDAVAGRWLPFCPSSLQPVNGEGIPLTTGVSGLQGSYPMIPGRFLISSSDKYPVVTGNQPWDQRPDLQRTEGVGPTSRKVILTNCGFSYDGQIFTTPQCCNAFFVYTRLVTVIEEWDDLFREAMVTMMAMVLAPVAIDDRRSAMAERDRLIPILKNAVDNARVANGNEAGFAQTVDQDAQWISARNLGGWGNGWGNNGGLGSTMGPGGGGGGIWGCGWDSCSWCGNVF